MNGSELLLVRLCVAREQLELLAKAARCISYCSCRSSSVKIIAACAVPRPMILGGDDGERLIAFTTNESMRNELMCGAGAPRCTNQFSAVSG